MYSVVEDFLDAKEREYLRLAMEGTQWTDLKAMPYVAKMFQGCGNWKLGVVEEDENTYLRSRLDPLFELEETHRLAVSYYRYDVGDSLSLHTDEYDENVDGTTRNTDRKVAIILYLHERWGPRWGGEIIIGDVRIPPHPGMLVYFDVPLEHRVARVTPYAENPRLTVSGWYISKEQNPSEEGLPDGR